MRAASLGVAVGGLTLVGHGLGHGRTSVPAALLVMGLAIAVAAALTSTRLRLSVLVAFVVGFEFAGHWLLARLSGHVGVVAESHAGHVPPSGAVAHSAATAPLPLVDADPASVAMSLPDGRMLLGHGLAAALIVALAWSADSALHRLETALDRLLAVVFGPRFYIRVSILVPSFDAGMSAERVVPALTPTAALPALTHRGPPLLKS